MIHNQNDGCISVFEKSSIEDTYSLNTIQAFEWLEVSGLGKWGNGSSWNDFQGGALPPSNHFQKTPSEVEVAPRYTHCNF